MPTTIKLKNSVTTTNAPSSLVQGEVAINITDKKVWVGNAATTPIQLLGGGADGSFTNISVSSVATFGAGTVSLPSITTTGDTNTGIFFPAADTIAFTEGGVESMRIDSSGNVGIGTASPTTKLDVSGQARFSSGATASAAVLTSTNAGGTALNIQNSGTVNSLLGGYNSIVGSGNATDVMLSATQGVLAFGTGASSTERMRIDSSGNVGIGTSSPAARLHVSGTYGTTATGGVRLVGIGNTTGDLSPIAFYLQSSNWGTAHQATITAQQVSGTDGGSNLLFGTSTSGGSAPTERMRIGSDGSMACTAVTTNGPYFRAGNTNSVANNGTISITNSRAAGALICVYETGGGLGGIFYANYSTTVTKIAGDGSATDAGANFAVYKNANDHVTTFKNRSGGTSTYTIAVYSAFSVN